MPHFNILLNSGNLARSKPLQLNRSGIVTFFLCSCIRGKYYKMAGEEELEAFLSQPERFVAPAAPRPLPPLDLLPKRCSHISIKTMFPKKFEIQGFCPVTYIDGGRRCVHVQCCACTQSMYKYVLYLCHRYESLVPGNPSFAAEYKNKLFCFAHQEQLEQFMRLVIAYNLTSYVL